MAMLSQPPTRSASQETLLSARGLTRVHKKGAREVVALMDANLTINQGEYVAITGPSGSGKSTLLSLLGLLDRSSSGVYRIGGRDVSSLGDRAASALRNEVIGFVFQGFHLIPHLSAWRNVSLPLSYAGWRPGSSASERKDRSLAALDSVGMLKNAEHLPRELSGGQEQRVAIARALVNEPKLILADEPTGNLDSNSRDGILSLFENANQRGVTIILVTHDPYVASQAHRTVQLEDGRVIN